MALWLSLASVLAVSHAAVAQPVTPPLKATLKFETPPPPGGYGAADPITLILQVENTSGAQVLTVGGFSSSEHFRRLYFTDPAGGTVINQAEEQLHGDVQPLQCLSRNGVLQSPAVPIQPVDVLPSGPAGTAQNFFREYKFDARTFYDVSQPGHYSVNARIPLLVFSASDPSAIFSDCDLFEGTFVNLGALTGRQGFTIVSNTLEFDVAGPPQSRALTALGPAMLWIGLSNSDDVGIRFDLMTVVKKNGIQVGAGQLNSVRGGSSGFNNARLSPIPLSLTSGQVGVSSGDLLSIEVSIRNACTGSGKNSGSARLWFNDAGANSRFGATIGSVDQYHLRDGGALTTTVGTGPRKSVDTAAGARCSPFKSVGTWGINLP